MATERSPLTRSEDDRRELIVWAVGCVERALPLFEDAHPADPAVPAAEDAWQRAHLPEGLAEFVYPAG